MATPIVAGSGTGSANNASSITIAGFTMTGNLLMVLTGYRGNAADVSSVTYGGVNLTLLEKAESTPASFETAAEIWYLKSPALGSANIVITYGANQYGAAIALDISGSRTGATTFGTTAETAGVYDSAISTNVTSAAGELVIDIVAKKFTNATDGVYVVGAGQTQIGASVSSGSGTDSNNAYIAASKETATGTPTTMSWTWTSGNRYAAQIGVAVRGALAAGSSQVIIF